MAFFDFLFGKKNAKHGMLFTTSIEIEKTLFHIGLNQAERAAVKDLLMKYMGSGGVTVGEYTSYVLPELYKMMEEGKISSVDYKKLKELVYS